MTGLNVAVALFAAFMLVRHLPAAVRALRGRTEEGRAGRPGVAAALVPLTNVVLALALLAMAVKGLAGVLIRR
jgi:hypothetical protein